MDAPPVQYVTTSDGYDIAYTVAGHGMPFVMLPGAFNNVQLNWSPGSQQFVWLTNLASRFQLIAYDARGQGMSTRGVQPGDWIGNDLRDLHAVLDHLEFRGGVFMADVGRSHLAVHYAVLHPERTYALILHRPFLKGAEDTAVSIRKLAEQRWEFFLQMQAGGRLMVDSFEASVTQADWLTRLDGMAASDITDLLPLVRSPTLVLHPRDQSWVSQEQAGQVAARVPNAHFVVIDRMYFLDTPATLQTIDSFLAGISSHSADSALVRLQRNGDLVSTERLSGLSARELEVLRLLATGKSNQQIADELVISLNTVRRHVSNIFDKTGVANRAQAVVYARDRGLA